MKKILGIAAGIAGLIFVAVKLVGALVCLLIVIGAVLLAAAFGSLLKRK